MYPLAKFPWKSKFLAYYWHNWLYKNSCLTSEKAVWHLFSAFLKLHNTMKTLFQNFVAASILFATPTFAQQSFVASNSRELSFNDFQANLSRTEINEKVGFTDKKGKTKVIAKYDNAFDMYEGLAAVQQNKKWGFVDKDGNEVIDLQFDEVANFSQGLAAVRVGEKWGFVNKKGAVEIAEMYEDVLSFSENLAFVKQYGKWGVIDKKNKMMQPHLYIHY